MAANRLREWREARGFSRHALAERTGCHLQTILRLEAGRMALTLDWMERLAPALNVEPGDLLPARVAEPPSQAVVLVPIVSWDQLPDLPLGAEAQATRGPRLAVARGGNGGRNGLLVALPVLDDTMSRVAPTGAFILLNRQDRALVDGKYYVVKAGSEVLFRQYCADPARFEGDGLVRCRPLFLKSRPNVLGRVCQVIREL